MPWDVAVAVWPAPGCLRNFGWNLDLLTRRRLARNFARERAKGAAREADAAECLLRSEQMETQSFSHRESCDGRDAATTAIDLASVVANSDHLVGLCWKPELNDLSTMIEHPYRWRGWRDGSAGSVIIWPGAGWAS